MRYCSFKRKDIEFHYRRMSQRYHTLGGINDHSLKQVYVNSLPDELQDEIQRKIDTSGRSLNDTSLGELHMYALSSLDKLCATQRFFSKMLTEGKKLQSQCKQPSLQIKGKSLGSCTCKTKKKTHFKHFKNKKGSFKIFKFFKKKAKRGSHTTMMNPKVLPPEFWKPHVRHFKAADGKVFSTNLISRKKIGIKFFPSFPLWVQVIGTPLPDKDILLG
ncbi:hypothetical protein LWI29_015176 [Acer saccharum]|uniref:Uncharacterized protein n=1 Tax=Acer saccharum TaxID=4024 RepID=A0AA39TEF3_ACESA|nr:hypothetical protein LWI29_015176 [Acer saccharum]